MTGLTEPQQFDVMIDIETLGVSRIAPMMSLGACIFDRYSGNILSEFYEVIRASDVVEHGNFEAHTLSWWFKQSREAKQGLLPEDGLSYTDVLYNFLNWLKVDFTSKTGLSQHIFWANGPSFDIEILNEHFNRYSENRSLLRSPWHYRNIRDCRTMWDLYGERPFWDFLGDPHLNAGVKHNARYDAILQARQISLIFRMMIKKER